MLCPACSHELSQKEIAGITVDVCSGGCGGIWFDNFELKKFDEQHEAAGQELLDIPRDPSCAVDLAKRRSCPRCTDTIMMQHLFSPNDRVTIDECPKCGGIWLDTGELAAIRTRFATEAERQTAAQAFLAGLCDDAFELMKGESGKDREWASKFTHALRFICPSYYIPGKQDWGAF